MTATSRVAQRAHAAHRILDENNFKQRAKELESIGERGFALMLYWTQIEISLKLMRYGYSVKDGWPETLIFLGTTWKPLQNLKRNNLSKYDLVLGGGASSLWKTRNGIAHEGRVVSVAEYRKYLDAALWVITELKKETPNLERLREKKHRSNAQLKVK